MKLIRYGELGREKPGLVDDHHQLRDLSSLIGDLTAEQLSPKNLAWLASIQADQLPLVSGKPRLGVPITSIGKFIAIGLNYSDHAAEAGMALPTEPVIFMKAVSCLSGANDPIMLPQGSQKTDWEIELAVVIGSKAQYVDESEALQHVAGYCLANDVSEREFQLERGTQWDKGKGCDTFGPLGPWLVTRDEISDVQNLGMWLDVNGERMQTGNTKTMVFSVAQIVSYVSRFMTLLAGDVIITGTPPGVGMGMKPPRFLKAGDVVTLGIEELGEQRHEVIAYHQS